MKDLFVQLIDWMSRERFYLGYLYCRCQVSNIPLTNSNVGPETNVFTEGHFDTHTSDVNN